MKKFLAGLGIGAMAGLLLAPQEGKKTRAVLADRFSDWFDRTRAQARPAPVDEMPESEAIAEVLNTASKHELTSVPGIGKGTAKKIIEHRPYESKEEILQEGVLPEAILERVQETLLDKSSDVA